jgi:dTDP-D-glucose 4,6-dehydratase
MSTQVLQSPKKLSELILCAPRSPYSFAKHSSIHFLQMLYRSEGWPISIARIFLTYGPVKD